ncbi:hypothetical protein [Pseudomonas sp.]|uniref:hypothetical protein n=1 Tax=Pseudomonas sp. TaxID=306 RepID=UPI003BB67028
MITKGWREYTVTVRPFSVLAWLLVSPAVVLPILWLGSTDGVDWPAWVQAIGSVIAIVVAVWISSRQHARDQEWRGADRAERNCGMALRLNALITEYHRLVCNVLPQGEEAGNIETDQALAGLLESIKVRLDSNFDDDFDHHRQVEINNTRSCLAAVIFFLQHRDDTQHGLRIRAENVERARRSAEESLAKSLVMYREAYTERVGTQAAARPHIP